jgi:hypothetical protein
LSTTRTSPHTTYLWQEYLISMQFGIRLLSGVAL